jgi:hypothetical protein
LGYILFGSYNGTAPVQAAGFTAAADAAWSATSTPALFSFATTAIGSTARLERMRITSAGLIGIGTTAPEQELEVNGGIRLNTSTAQPLCNATSNARGTLWVTKGGTGVADTVEICVKDASENYAWYQIH